MGAYLSQTDAGVGLKKLLGNETTTVGIALLLLLIFLDVSVLRLEILDQGVDVLIFLLADLGLGLVGGGRVGGAV